jgi:methylglyoxal reductase
VESAYPAGSLRRSTEQSLTELSVDTIDLMQLHQYWPHWDRSDYWMEELFRLKEEGKIRFIGLSIPDQRHDIALSIVQSGKIDSIQTVFNIFDPIPFMERVNRLRKFIPAYADNLAELAIKFALKHPGVTAALISMHIPEYATQNINAVDKR